jgi:hypothetical protein
VSRLIGAVAAIAVGVVAFLGGQAVAGGADKTTDAKPRPVAQASGSVPEAIRHAEGAVVLPVLSVRSLPSLAAPHRKLIKPTPTQTQTPAVQTPLQQNVTPTPPVKQPQQTTPRRNSGNSGSGGSGGYFDDSG